MSESSNDDDMLADEWAKALEEQDDEEEEKVEQAQLDELVEDVAAQTRVEPAPQNDASAEDSPDLGVILDIPVTIAMEVGTTEINIRNLLLLNQGSVIELDRVAGEPLDVTVNGTLIAHGEVVVVNEKFGIRLTDIISQSERIQKIN
ncbi:MAG: flagellar motor switch protein FliN [Gammaproteobacteria bacterium]|nr:flagellar motor switch protein FliN [Gammaproteobacteria bacterium]